MLKKFAHLNKVNRQQFLADSFLKNFKLHSSFPRKKSSFEEIRRDDGSQESNSGQKTMDAQDKHHSSKKRELRIARKKLFQGMKVIILGIVD